MATANDLLDSKLSDLDDHRVPVVKLPSHLRGREIGSRAELKALLTDLEDRIGPHLDKGARVRIV